MTATPTPLAMGNRCSNRQTQPPRLLTGEHRAGDGLPVALSDERYPLSSICVTADHHHHCLVVARC
ncbi:hypothetical protein HanIR_Chr17g0896091 [Helianthus annuus]|nr:hypothetical protein HanIR_Chr17g0896091 [Helianthus annuus]